MTYETLLKHKELYEKRNDKVQLAKVLKNLAKYEVPKEEVTEDTKTKSKSKGKK